MRHAKVDGNEGIYKVSQLDICIVPCEVVAEVEVNRSAAIKGNGWALSITKYVHALWINTKDGADGPIHILNETFKSRLIVDQSRICVKVRAHINVHPSDGTCQAKIHINA